MYKLNLKDHFVAAHKIPKSPSLFTKGCAMLHGHTYEVEIRIETNVLIDGMVIDFGYLKEIIKKYDHHYLNDIVENPTAENIAKNIYEEIKRVLLARNPSFSLSVKIKESGNSSIIYHE